MAWTDAARNAAAAARGLKAGTRSLLRSSAMTKELPAKQRAERAVTLKLSRSIAGKTAARAAVQNQVSRVAHRISRKAWRDMGLD